MWNNISSNYKRGLSDINGNKKNKVSILDKYDKYNNIYDHKAYLNNNNKNKIYRIDNNNIIKEVINNDYMTDNMDNRLSHSFDNISSSNNNKYEIKNDYNHLNLSLNTYSFNTKPKGLQNIGATCYMNATLQCFYHIDKLTKYIINEKYIQDRINIKGNTIAYEYINLVKELYKKDGKEYIAPYNFKDILGRENPLFRGVAANDSKDLILYLQQTLAKELTLPSGNLYDNYNQNYKYNILDQTDENNVLNSFLKDFAKEKNIIKDLFYFITKTKTECQSCHIPLYNFQIGNFLIFPLEKTYYENINNISYNNILINNTNNNLNNDNLNNMINNMMINMMNTNMMYSNMMNTNIMNNNIMGMNNMIMNNNNTMMYNLPNNYNSNNIFSNNFFNNFNLNNNQNYINNSNYHNNNLKKNLSQKKIIKDKNNYYNNNYNINNNSSKKDNLYRKYKSLDKTSKSQDINNNFFNNYNNYNNIKSNKLLLGSGPNNNSLSSYKKQKPRLNLYQCFDSSLKPELLTGDNKNYCNRCKKLVDAYYTSNIYTSSNILVIILNYGKGVLFECDVDFDEHLNISKYVEKKEKSVPVNYRLLGIIVHKGPSSMDGHFIAYCRGIENKQKWYQLNDALVSEATFSEIKNSGMPYVLFYENINKY